MTDHLDERTYDIFFGIQRSVRYHLHRRRFYEQWNTITVAAGVFGGSSAVAAAFANAPFWSASLAAGVAIISALDLAVGTAKMANVHSDLARQFMSLQKHFADDKNLTDEAYANIVCERLTIEQSEPTPLRLLDALCHYELLRAMGDTTQPPRIPFWRRFVQHFFSQAAYTRTTVFSGE